VVNCIVKTLFHFCDDGTDCVLVLLVCFYIDFRNHYSITDRFTAFVVLTRCFVNYFLLSGLYYELYVSAAILLAINVFVT